MNKEEWIDSVLESTNGIKKAEASPFLFEKITSRIAQGETIVENGSKWGFALAAVVLISVNIFAVTLVSGEEKTDKKTEFVNSGPDQSVIYNY